MKEEQGVVIETDGRYAKIRVGRHEECSSCGACAASKHLVVEAVNALDAKVGERVKFAMKEEQMLLGAFVVFILPLVFAAFGAYGGWELSVSYGSDATKSAVLGAVLCFLFSLIAVKLFDRKAARDMAAKPVITEIL